MRDEEDATNETETGRVGKRYNFKNAKERERKRKKEIGKAKE